MRGIASLPNEGARRQHAPRGVGGAARAAAVAVAVLAVAGCGGSDATAPPPGTRLSLNFCYGPAPSFAAYQNDGGAWTRATVEGNVLSFTATGTKLGLTLVYASADETDVVAMFTTPAELATGTATACAPPPRADTLAVAVRGLGKGQSALVALGGAFVYADSDAAYQLAGVDEGARDLVAFRSGYGMIVGTPDLAIVRRGLNVTAGSTVAAVDFGSGDAQPVATAAITVGGMGADGGQEQLLLRTMNGTMLPLSTAALVSGAATLYGLPTSAQSSTDRYLTIVDVWSAAGKVRQVSQLAARFGDVALTLGPALSDPVVSVVATTPYLRVRAQLPRQAEYGSHASVSFFEFPSAHYFEVTMSAAYLGAASTWDLTIPDLSGVEGWNDAWALARADGTEWSAYAVSAPLEGSSTGTQTTSTVIAAGATSQAGLSASRRTLGRALLSSALGRATGAPSFGRIGR